MSIDDFKRAATGIRNAGLGSHVAFATPVPQKFRNLIEDDISINPAAWTYERLQSQFKSFEEKLDDEHEIGMRLVAFGPTLLFHIEKVGYHGPDMIIFYGKNEDGEDVQLLQHISQLNVLLVAAKKLGKEPRRIGFLSDLDDQAKSADAA